MTGELQNDQPEVKGWCPGALRPMLSGDGWVVRIKPRGGRLSQRQAAGIAQAAEIFGNGLLDLSNRANLQIRGVSERSLAPLVDALDQLSLIDRSAEAETRRNVMLTPFASLHDLALATSLEAALVSDAALFLPGKFGFVVDTGPRPVLQTAPGDIRLERGSSGDLLLCADGLPSGQVVEPENVVEMALALARHFTEHGGMVDGRGRMSAFVASGADLPGAFDQRRQIMTDTPPPGCYQEGALVGFAFGQLRARILGRLAAMGALRLTPWRMILLEGAAMPDLPGLITQPDDPLLQVIACTGAPGCRQALGETRSLALRLAGSLPPGATLHVSGCAKGCAHPASTPLTVVATTQGYGLIRDGKPSDTPERDDLTPAQIERAL